MSRTTYFRLTDATALAPIRGERGTPHTMFETPPGASQGAGIAYEFVRPWEPFDLPAYVEQLINECRRGMRPADYEAGGPFLYVGYRGPHLLGSATYAVTCSPRPMTFRADALPYCDPHEL